MALVNRQIRLKSRPDAVPQADNFELVEAEVPPLAAGQLLVRNHYLGVEPAMRGWVSAVSNYSEPVPLDGVMRAFTAGEVAESRHPGFKPGDRVTGILGWQDYAISDGAGVRRIPDRDMPLSLYLGVLGLNGLTAYFGLLDIGRPRAGETVVVSTAAGAVGSCAGQIAKLNGCRTIGIAGGPVKTKLCSREFGYDIALDYKATDFEKRLAQTLGGGADLYFDNTSGAISDAVHHHLNMHARVAICGTASIPTWDPWPIGPRIERLLLVKRVRMQGFIIFDYEHRYDEALEALSDWVRSGRLHYREEILHGLESAPDAIAGLYRGENLGRRLISLLD
jgi:NADPH-dependent curcumin reductase CurA